MGRGAKWYFIIGYLIFLGFVAGAIGPDLLSTLRSYTWHETPCIVVHSEIVEEPFSRTVTDYVLRVEYSYRAGERECRSQRFKLGKRQGFSDINRAQKAASRLAGAARTVCYVNPANPTEAILERGDFSSALVFGLLAIFPAFLMHESVFGWVDRHRRKKQMVRDIPLSETNDALRVDPRRILSASICVMAGTLFLFYSLVEPFWDWSKSRNWPSAAAFITRCELERESGPHGPHYSIKLVYQYDFELQKYQSNRRRFDEPIGEAVIDLIRWVDSHPRGSAVQCWINPGDPTEAVLDRRPLVNWISSALGALMLVGGVWQFGMIRKTHWRKRNLAGKYLTDCCLGAAKAGTGAMLISLSHCVGTAILTVAGGIALSMLGIWPLLKGLQAAVLLKLDLMNLLYGIIPLVGAALLFKEAWKFIKRALRPRPALYLTPATPVIGGRIQLKWEFRPGQTLRSLRINLEGAEEAKVPTVVASVHGKISEEKLHRFAFCDMELVHATESHSSGQVVAQIPETAMHSFYGEKCAIKWQIRVRVEGHGPARLDYEFPITVRPAKI